MFLTFKYAIFCKLYEVEGCCDLSVMYILTEILVRPWPDWLEWWPGPELQEGLNGCMHAAA